MQLPDYIRSIEEIITEYQKVQALTPPTSERWKDASSEIERLSALIVAAKQEGENEPMKLNKIESLGNGAIRLHAYGIGFLDVECQLTGDTWNVRPIDGNVRVLADQSAMIDAFKRSEGME